MDVDAAEPFAVEGLSEALHDELAPLGIHVTVVEPGYFRTDFLDSTSLRPAATQIDDYAATAGAVRSRAGSLNHHLLRQPRPDDPVCRKPARASFSGLRQPGPTAVPFPCCADNHFGWRTACSSDLRVSKQGRCVSASDGRSIGEGGSSRCGLVRPGT